MKIKPPNLHLEPELTEKVGRRENLILKSIPLCPTFEPTLEEFTKLGFQEYLIECEKLLPPTCGVYKVSVFCLKMFEVQFVYPVLGVGTST